MGADVLIAYLCEDEDARETARLVEEAGRKAVCVAGDLSDPAHCRAVIDKALETLGGIDVLVSNAAHQASFEKFEDISDEEWRKTFAANADRPPSTAQGAGAALRPAGERRGELRHRLFR